MKFIVALTVAGFAAGLAAVYGRRPHVPSYR